MGSINRRQLRKMILSEVRNISEQDGSGLGRFLITLKGVTFDQVINKLGLDSRDKDRASAEAIRKLLKLDPDATASSLSSVYDLDVALAGRDKQAKKGETLTYELRTPARKQNPKLEELEGDLEVALQELGFTSARVETRFYNLVDGRRSLDPNSNTKSNKYD
tara:strand:- start:133 stop:621 length:489 start_codon:yes stop_codon:yes gene_type:complete